MTFHKTLKLGGWQNLSLFEQMGNIGSEISRASRAEDKKMAVERALELLDLTLADPRWKNRNKEIARTREVLCDTVYGDNSYNTSLADLNNYFYHFALAARLGK